MHDANELVGTVFSGLSALIVEGVTDGGEAIPVSARTRDDPVPCPACGQPTRRVHGFHGRVVADVPVDGRRVVVLVRVRRLVCPVLGCPRQTFREQVPGVVERYQRRTNRLTTQLGSVVWELAGRAGARLSRALACGISRSTALRMLMCQVATPLRVPRVLGIDDFALKRRHRYATVIIDAETGERIDVLPDRTAQTLTTCLREHPGGQYVCSDGSATYAEAIRQALPEAVQVSDRWDLWSNLCGKVLAEVRSHGACWATVVNPTRPGGVREQTTRERRQRVRHLLGQGVGLLECTRRLDVALNTVKRYARMKELTGDRRAPVTSPRSSIPTVTTCVGAEVKTLRCPSLTSCARARSWATPAAPTCWSAISPKAAPRATSRSPPRGVSHASHLPAPRIRATRTPRYCGNSPQPAPR